MLRLATRSKLLGASARFLAPAAKTQEREFSLTTEDQTKAVVFNLAGGVVPSMDSVFKEYAIKYTIPPKPDAIKQKVLMEADDAQLLENINLMLGSRNASQDENTADLMDAVASIKGEGWKTVLVNDPGQFKNIPAIDTSVFDHVIDKLTPEFVAGFDTNVAKSDIVYVDNAPDNLAAAESLGLSTVAVGANYGEALIELEGKLGAPLKACIPGVTFNWYDRANNPHKKNGGYMFIVFLGMVMVTSQAAMMVNSC